MPCAPFVLSNLCGFLQSNLGATHETRSQSPGGLRCRPRARRNRPGLDVRREASGRQAAGRCFLRRDHAELQRGCEAGRADPEGRPGSRSLSWRERVRRGQDPAEYFRDGGHGRQDQVRQSGRPDGRQGRRLVHRQRHLHRPCDSAERHAFRSLGRCQGHQHRLTTRKGRQKRVEERPPPQGPGWLQISQRCGASRAFRHLWVTTINQYHYLVTGPRGRVFLCSRKS